VSVTSAPARANSPAARMPTGPVPAVMTTRRPRSASTVAASLCTAATAVVFDPFESSITETRSGPKKVACTSCNSRSPSGMLAPPTQIALWWRSFGPRVNIRPCTRSRTAPAVTPP
jgi:hypothetical protein